MAYPTVSAPYGLKPINLIGGQVFAGSTRNIPIQYNFGTNIFYGDVVGISRGFITRSTVTTGAGATTGSAGNGTIGVFLGCSYTDPITKQKRYSQYWPANTLAGDGVAVVADDPDVLFKSTSVTTQGGTQIGSFATSMIGLNVAGSDLAGSVNNGDSSNAMYIGTVANTASLPFRIVDLVRDTAVASTATYSSAAGSGATYTLTTSALPSALVVGTEVGYIAANGQYVGTSSWVSTAAAAGATTVLLNYNPVTANSPTGTTGTAMTIPASSTLVFTQYPEAIVKFNFGIHEYYNNTAQAATL
jgi:hypothetical protein